MVDRACDSDQGLRTTPPGSLFPALREWAQDEPHMGQSVRHWQPTYPNPAALRRDVRALLAVLDRAKDLADSIDLWDSDGIPVDIGIDAEAGKLLELRKVLDG